ncbi:Rid family detoxifying hydrolase [Niabella beijingensis]|uniref:Rid family detoxifying hydrolase n=1 Tax=Niabella beijingensis TaxID=2872700 RepID=UPI001CBAE538|nr:Rid family detoxifying hydrolase [Niabella beijingensis]MBZ4187709.1 Rid family detoxifying hydrolase [Niabella beijingensis]
MKKVIFSSDAPAPIGPFSQGVVAQGALLYVSGNIGMKPGETELVTGGIREQTKQVLSNMKAIVSEAGYSLSDVVKVNVYLTDMKDFASMNEEYAEIFSELEPARTTVQVAGLPKNAMVEMELTAVI